MKDLRIPKIFLGIQIERKVHKRIMTLKQTRYIRCVLKRFHANELPGTKTPALTRNAERKTPENSKRKVK